MVEKPVARFAEVREGAIDFAGVRLPLRPMVGAVLAGLVALAGWYGIGALGYGPEAQRDGLSVLSFGYGILQKALAAGLPADLPAALVLLGFVAVGKILTTSLTIGSGGSAGVFGPSMVIGGAVGAVVGLLFRDGQPLVYAGGDFPASQRRAVMLADMSGFRARQAAARGEGRYIGIGLANYVEGTGLGPFEGVSVRVLPNGKVAVATGATSQGQGTRTSLSQIVADEVGCRLEDVVLTAGDAASARPAGAATSARAAPA